jgi:hypothetical protein
VGGQPKTPIVLSIVYGLKSLPAAFVNLKSGISDSHCFGNLERYCAVLILVL